MDEIEIMKLVIEGKDQTIQFMWIAVGVMGSTVMSLCGVIFYLYKYNQNYGKKYHNAMKKITEAINGMARKQAR